MSSITLLISIVLIVLISAGPFVVQADNAGESHDLINRIKRNSYGYSGYGYGGSCSSCCSSCGGGGGSSYQPTSYVQQAPAPAPPPPPPPPPPPVQPVYTPRGGGDLIATDKVLNTKFCRCSHPTLLHPATPAAAAAAAAVAVAETVCPATAAAGTMVEARPTRGAVQATRPVPAAPAAPAPPCRRAMAAAMATAVEAVQCADANKRAASGQEKKKKTRKMDTFYQKNLLKRIFNPRAVVVVLMRPDDDSIRNHCFF
uniref:WAS/WASL-interacting protein family member 3-like n=1 Tax=Globodera pallida TaxID=36090 RepID=A0A183CAF9_GLOPA